MGWHHHQPQTAQSPLGLASASSIPGMVEGALDLVSCLMQILGYNICGRENQIHELAGESIATHLRAGVSAQPSLQFCHKWSKQSEV